MRQASVSRSTRVSAWRALSSALTWASGSPSVPEIKTNGCKLAKSLADHHGLASMASDYEVSDSALAGRLVVVQAQIRAALDQIALGPVRAISVCAGQGHDLIRVLAEHSRRDDVSALLVELDEHKCVHVALRTRRVLTTSARSRRARVPRPLRSSPASRRRCRRGRPPGHRLRLHHKRHQTYAANHCAPLPISSPRAAANQRFRPLQVLSRR
jgi:hypothetical protein